MLTVAGVLALFALPRVAPVAAPTTAISHILVDKSDRRLELLSGDAVVRSYEISLGFAPDGDKQQEGDGRTPEGRYLIEGRNPDSAFHLSLKISYPDAADRAVAAGQGVAPGGDIFIHGAPNWWLLPGQPPGEDQGLHRRDRCGDRRDLVPGPRRHPDRDQALRPIRSAA